MSTLVGSSASSNAVIVTLDPETTRDEQNSQTGDGRVSTNSTTTLRTEAVVHGPQEASTMDV